MAVVFSVVLVFPVRAVQLDALVLVVTGSSVNVVSSVGMGSSL